MGSESVNNIVYLDYRTSATAKTQYEDSVKPESFSNIIKNNFIVYDNILYIAGNCFEVEP